jgi:phenylacetate-CoA ligase
MTAERTLFWDERIETLSRDALTQLQSGRLQWQITRCYEGSAFYRERLDRAGITPADVAGVEFVQRLPILTGHDLAREQERHPPFGRFVVAPQENWRALYRSTGGADSRFASIWSEADLANLANVSARVLWMIGARQGDIVQNALDFESGAGIAAHLACDRVGCLIAPSVQIARHARVLLVDARHALTLAQERRHAGVSPDRRDLRICGFVGAGDAEEPVHRQEVEAALGLAALECFGRTEISPMLAAACSQHAGLHWPEDHVLLEVLDLANHEPAAQGETGVLVVTHLTRQATPLLRYWTGLRARLHSAPCGCGRTHARTVEMAPVH